MRFLRWGLVATLLAACGSSPSSVSPDTGLAGKRDAGTSPGADAGTAGLPDAAASSSSDAGAVTAADAGKVSMPDTGALQCKLESPVHAIKLAASLQNYELADVTAGDGMVAIAYSWNRNFRKLKIVEAATGKVLADQTMANIDGSTIPRALDYADGLFFAAGNFDDATSALYPYTRLAYYDGLGAAKDWSQEDGFLSVAAVREASGGRTLALGKALATGETPIYLNRFDLTGSLTDSVELGRNARKYNEWDLEWRHASDTGMACGLASDEGVESLSVWTMSGDASLVAARTSVAIAGVTTAEAPLFGCRISLGTALAAVAVGDGVGGARLIWLGLDGSTLAGPVPFSAYKRASKYDVAVDGAVTALAHLDESSGTPRVAVKIFPSPAQAPIELFGEVDLNLGTFDFTGRKVRLARAEGGFVLAFDANIKLGQTDLYVRRILCQ